MTKNLDSYWSDLYRSGRDYRTISADAIDKFLSFTVGGDQKTCLDIGCGTGQLTRELCRRGYRAVGIDVSTEAIKVAQKSSAALSDEAAYINLNIEQGDVHPLPNSSYDLITCKLVYAFIDNKPKFLERIKTLLAPSGRFIVVTPLQTDVPLEKRDVAVNKNELTLLSKYFRQVALYRSDNLTYFVGALA